MKMETNQLPNVHPGEVLQKDYLEPLGISPQELAKALGVTRSGIEAILEGVWPITAHMALRLSRYFGASAQFWLNLQDAFDLEEAEKHFAERLEKIRRHMVNPEGDQIMAKNEETTQGNPDRCEHCRYVGAPTSLYPARGFQEIRLCRLCASMHTPPEGQANLFKAIGYVGNVILEKIEGRADRSDEE